VPDPTPKDAKQPAGGRHSVDDAKQPAGGRHSVDGAGKVSGKATPGARAMRVAREVAIVVAAAIVLSFLLKTFLIQSFTIPSRSMVPTLLEGDRVIVTKLAPGPLQLHRGDVVVFQDPGGWVTDHQPSVRRAGLSRVVYGALREIGLAPADSTDYLIKRLVGLPGDEVTCGGPGELLTINGVAVTETYLPPETTPCSVAFEVVVPPDAMWVMGDNRDASSDSRAHMDEALNGAVKQDLVVGVAQLRSWPISRWTVMRNPGAVFASVPAPNQGGP